jgi:prepilin-type N-terminal cleavage/methylation domain-containing protein
MFEEIRKQQEQGFTLIEVLVGILITTIFVLVSMQTLVLAAWYRIRAQEVSDALLLIQEDLENIKYEAATYSAPSGSDFCGGTQTTGYGDALRDKIYMADGGSAEDTTSTTYSLTKTAPSSENDYTINKTLSITPLAPYAMLQVSYSVPLNAGGSPYEFYAEVIPDEVFDCP